ncbi:sensor histidine kinase [Bailinhaonella thermotolerans]|uniref:histidine kinase n=1 Tax=Bailinhaonella thermotolerans TaxID=1070861 RepID=A0A3A4AKM3_9ACTN|nr:histidine kinase [Bailinhaonella thermotolerans]RJL27077.1 two-component sensor histidine kinase [Bailinhaonella thermotolerans]
MTVMWLVDLTSAVVAVAAAGSAAARPRFRRRLSTWAALAAGVSAAVTLVHLTGLVRAVPATALPGMIESGALMALAGLAVRYAPARRAAVAAPLAGLAAACWLLRVFTPASPLEQLGACAFWGLGAMLAASVGGYLRVLDVRRERAVAETRLAMRLRLAGDLHDYLAHDISEMVAHAQAGQVAGDPRQALERVEAAGRRALSMLDRTLDMLHHDRPLAPGGDLAGIRDAAERFSAAGPARVELRMDPDVTAAPETAALAYRIVIEGLTNVRRHAPQAGRVALDVTASSGVLEIAMTNDGVARARGGGRGRARGGSGLPALAALVRDHGGELSARAVPQGWSLTARLPLAQSPEWSPASSSPTTRKASAAPSA